MASISDDKVVVMIGKRDTGKSFLCRDLLYYHQDIPVGTVISATEIANCFYGKMVPPLFIHNEYNEEVVKKVLIRQTRCMEQVKKEKNSFNFNGQSKKTDPRTFVILDDCLYDNSWTKSKFVRSLFMNGRHWKVFFIITMQYALGIPPNLRTNIDYVFILRENIVQNRKRLYECYAGMFPTFEVFCEVMDQTTENYECLVINNNSKSNNLEDQVFWYKAEPHDDFKLGSKELWDYHNQNYISSGNTIKRDEEKEWDPNLFNSKKNKPSINVHKYNDMF
tara:strand:- start:403 stop:1236 length:834 start_codon:yes stop_codon:yes gene_type:complete